MMFAGYIGATESWAWAALITIPGGVLIAAAFVFARRAVRDEGPRRGT